MKRRNSRQKKYPHSSSNRGWKDSDPKKDQDYGDEKEYRDPVRNLEDESSRWVGGRRNPEERYPMGGRYEEELPGSRSEESDHSRSARRREDYSGRRPTRGN